MVSGREVTFRFKIDLSRFDSNAKAAVQQLRNLERQSGSTASSLDRVGQSAGRAGQQSAASAVNFQTATQGMLNLSTAAVQTYTSISNLDRANNRAKQSIIAVARAEDLLNNKKERLNQLLKSGNASEAQVANIRREIATATADLTVKEEKMAIEKAAVNDVYMLFATNIANVTISSLQTITVLVGQERVANIASTLAMKLKNVATWENVSAMRANAAASRLSGLSDMQVVASKTAVTMATRVATGAMNAFKIALGPIGLIFIGISAAMVAYETNLGGIKDTINGLLGIQDNFKDSLDEERNAIDDVTSSTGKLDDEMTKLPNSYDAAKQRMEEYRKKLVEVKKWQDLTAQSADLLNGKIPITLSQISDFQRVSQPQKGKTFAERIAQALDIETYFPPAAAQEYSTPNAYETIRQLGINLEGPLPSGKTKEQVIEDAVQFITGSEFMKPSERAKEYRAEQRQKMLDMLRLGKTTITSMLGTNLTVEAVRDYAKQFDPSVGGEYLITPGTDRYGYSYDDWRWFRGVKGGTVKGLSRSDRDKYISMDFLMGRSKGEESTEESKRLMKLDNRQFVKQAIGFDIGGVANVISRNDAIRIGILEKQMQEAGEGLVRGPSAAGDVANDIRNQRIAEALYTAGAGYRREAALNDIRSVSGGQLGQMMSLTGQTTNTNFFGKGFYNAAGATAAYQVPRGSIAVPSWVKAQIAREDAWRNSVEGQNAQAAQALLTGGSFAYSRRVARAGGGLSQDVAMTIRAAGLLGVSVPYEAFKTTANEIYTGAASGLSEIMKETGTRQEFLFAAMDAISKTALQVYQTPYGWSSIRMGGAPYQQERRQYQVQGLKNYVSRVAQGNFGIYDATVLNAMTGAYVSEYTSEISDFNSKIAPLLNIAHSDFKTTLVDPKRGINEIDDRIRWTQRLEQISTGATVF